MFTLQYWNIILIFDFATDRVTNWFFFCLELLVLEETSLSDCSELLSMKVCFFFLPLVSFTFWWPLTHFEKYGKYEEQDSASKAQEKSKVVSMQGQECEWGVELLRWQNIYLHKWINTSNLQSFSMTWNNQYIHKL